jgi:protein associated with RNAse G/E
VEWDDQWQPDFLYIDIATAVDWNEETVRYVDLDLDLIRRHGSPTTELDDEDEFEEHRLRWNYPEKLVRQCWQAVEEVSALLDSETAPFSASTFAWRPANGTK